MNQDADDRQIVLQDALAKHQQGRLFEAEKACRDILRAWPDHFHALHLLGVVLLQSGRAPDGVAQLRKAIVIAPDFAPAHVNLANGLCDLKRPAEALVHYELAIALQPDLAQAYSNRGNALTALRRPVEALDSYDRAIALAPGFAEAHCNKARALLKLGRPQEALESCDRAIARNPKLAGAWGSRATALDKLRRYPEAIMAYAKLLDLAPGYPFVKGMYLYQKMHSCDWPGLESLVAEIENDIALGRSAAEPFGWQAAAKSPRSLQQSAECFHQKRFPEIHRTFATSAGHDRIRIGYVCGEFREHATSLLLAGVFENHDVSRFDVFAFDNGHDDASKTRRRIEEAIPNIIPIGQLDDFSAANLVAENGIDILVNLNGYFGGERMSVFAQRPAPIQVNYLGFPGTLGAGYIDYLIADPVVIPSEERVFYSEKIAWLPNSYQANDDKKEICEEPVNRAVHGLPDQAVVLCCFNNNYKILPGMFDVWMRILAKIKNSVLWLLEDHSAVAANLRQEAAARNINPDRLVFAKRLPPQEHLARHGCADLFIDTLPYNAHTTASDALWAGLPLVTCKGTTFPGRVAASLLQAVGMPELITENLDDYERLVVTLAHQPERRKSLKKKLVGKRSSCALFDTRSYTRHLETSFAMMQERRLAGLSPDHLVVPDVKRADHG